MSAQCPRARWFVEQPLEGLILDLGFVGENNHLLHDLIQQRAGARSIVFGLDYSAPAVCAARLSHSLAGDATRLPFENDIFDFVIAGELLEHIAPCDPVLSEAYRVLKPGGRFLISTPNGFDALKLLRWWLLPRRLAAQKNYRGWLGHPDHRNVLSPPSLMGRLNDCGFEIVDCQTRRFRVPFLQKVFGEQIILTWRIYPFTRLGEFVCIEARKSTS